MPEQDVIEDWPWQLNGKKSAQLSLSDRGLHYGDGVFESVAIINEQIPLREQHLQRLSHGLKVLQINCDAAQAWQALEQYLASIALPPRAMAKLIVTRGSGEGGYLPSKDATPSVAVRAFAWPNTAYPCATDGIAARLCKMRLACNETLAGIKHLNRLEQVIARSEWREPEISEGLLCDTDGYLVEGTMSNLFFVSEETLYTPLLDRCGVAGVMREHLLDNVLPSLPFATVQGRYGWEQLAAADEVFVCNSLRGVLPVLSCEHLSWPSGHVTRQVQAAVQSLFE